MGIRLVFAVAATAAALSLATAASAHVTLETPTARVGSYYKAVFRVPHGCDGTPTLKLRVQIPAGVVGVKPMPKPGWTLATITGRYDKPVAAGHGRTLTEGVKEVDWNGRLPDNEYDEFAIFAYLSADLKAGTRLYFPTVQECATGAARWIEIPPAGPGEAEVEHPAPGLELLPR